MPKAQSLNIPLMILLAVPAAVLFAQDAASEAPIRAIVADQVVAWNAGDGQAYARHLAPDLIRRIRFVTPDVAIVDIDNEVRGVTTMPGGIVVPPDGVVKTQLIEVFVRREGRWWIEAHHNVDVKPTK
jgi:hypothetical protein